MRFCRVNTAVEEMTLDDFFLAVPSEDRRKFGKLTRVLKERLTGIKVFRVGDKPEKDFYIVGRSKDGRWD